MASVLFVFILLVDFLLFFGIVISIFFPKRRIWPPPKKDSWQFWVSWILFDIGMIGSGLIGFIDFYTVGYGFLDSHFCRRFSDFGGWWRCLVGSKNAEHASKFWSERKGCDGGSVSVFAESTVHRLHSHVCWSDLCEVFVHGFSRRNHDDCYVCYSSLQRGTMANAAVWENLC